MYRLTLVTILPAAVSIIILRQGAPRLRTVRIDALIHLISFINEREMAWFALRELVT